MAIAQPLDIRLMNLTAALLAGLVAVAFAWMAVAWLAQSPVFNIRGVRVEGDVARVNAAALRANATPRLSGNLFTMDLDAARAAFESVPWVRRAMVRRVWPDRLAVTLEEHEVAAFWGEERLVNTHGEVFEANLGDVEDETLPVLWGPEGSAAEVLALYRRLAPVFARLETRIERLTLSSRGHWHAELDRGADIELGRGTQDEVVARAQRFVATITQVTSQYPGPLEYADLRHSNGYAVRIRGVTIQAPPRVPGARN
jgi:cell division protein FtsQ